MVCTSFKLVPKHMHFNTHTKKKINFTSFLNFLKENENRVRVRSLAFKSCTLNIIVVNFTMEACVIYDELREIFIEFDPIL